MLTFVVAAQLNAVPGGYTLTAPFPNAFTREGGKDPSQAGDVLSVQPDGSLQTRPKGTAGAWEICTISGITLLYNPLGPGTPVFWLLPTGI